MLASSELLCVLVTVSTKWVSLCQIPSDSRLENVAVVAGKKFGLTEKPLAEAAVTGDCRVCGQYPLSNVYNKVYKIILTINNELAYEKTKFESCRQ